MRVPHDKIGYKVWLEHHRNFAVFPVHRIRIPTYTVSHYAEVTFAWLAMGGLARFLHYQITSFPVVINKYFRDEYLETM